MNDPGRKWIEDAIADGFEVVDGDIDSEGPNSGKLTRGDVVVLWGKYTDSVTVKVWFSYGLGTVRDVPEVYNNEFVDVARGSCTDCKEFGDPSRLKKFRFVERLCPSCDTAERRAKGEFRGWAD